MHHPGFRVAALAATIALGASGCAVPHNNVLVFGTDTSFGINVDIAPDPSSPVGVAVGYKRKEAVWMPLVVNDLECTTLSGIAALFWGSCESDTATSLTTAERDDARITKQTGYGISETHGSSGIKIKANEDDSGTNGFLYKGKTGKTPDGKVVFAEDTYSVFASFGGNAKGGKDGAQLAVAQFFATGVAAQFLGDNPGAAQLVSVQNPETEALNQANMRAEAEEDAKQKTEQLLEISGLSKEDLAKKVSEANDLGERITQRKAITLQYIIESKDTLDGDAKDRWNAVQAEMTSIHGKMNDAKKQEYQDVVPLSLKTKFDAANTREDIKDLLEDEDGLLDLMYAAVTNLLNSKL